MFRRRTDMMLNDLSPTAIYNLLTSPPAGDGLPRWPDEDAQRQYVGNAGPILVERAQYFIEMLASDGALKNPDWQGLDYGCGWGRIASLMLTQGSADQLDLCDAWERSTAYLPRLGYKNRSWLVSEMLTSEDIPVGAYDFVYSFSVFTHLTMLAASNNLTVLFRGLKPGGRLYFTVRHLDWAAYVLSVGRTNAPRGLIDGGYWFEPLPENELFGDLVLTPKAVTTLVGALGVPRYIGEPEPLQHLYCLQHD